VSAAGDHPAWSGDDRSLLRELCRSTRWHWRVSCLRIATGHHERVCLSDARSNLTRCRHVLPARHGRLRARVCSAVRQSPAGNLERRVGTQMIKIVGVFIATRNGQCVNSSGRIAPIDQPMATSWRRRAARTSRLLPFPSCELSVGCPSGPGRGSWSCEASAILGRTG
jgi:hypothetical protein